jgi:hypothetical protein
VDRVLGLDLGLEILDLGFECTGLVNNTAVQASTRFSTEDFALRIFWAVPHAPVET